MIGGRPGEEGQRRRQPDAAPVEAAKLLHWYNFCFLSEDLKLNNAVVALTAPNVSQAAIIEGREKAEALPGAVLIAASYLGCMSEAAFNGTEEARESEPGDSINR